MQKLSWSFSGLWPALSRLVQKSGLSLLTGTGATTPPQDQTPMPDQAINKAAYRLRDWLRTNNVVIQNTAYGDMKKNPLMMALNQGGIMEVVESLRESGWTVTPPDGDTQAK